MESSSHVNYNIHCKRVSNRMWVWFITSPGFGRIAGDDATVYATEVQAQRLPLALIRLSWQSIRRDHE
jgi:hypothetical protein